MECAWKVEFGSDHKYFFMTLLKASFHIYCCPPWEAFDSSSKVYCWWIFWGVFNGWTCEWWWGIFWEDNKFLMNENFWLNLGTMAWGLTVQKWKRVERILFSGRRRKCKLMGLKTERHTKVFIIHIFVSEKFLVWNFSW